MGHRGGQKDNSNKEGGSGTTVEIETEVRMPDSDDESKQRPDEVKPEMSDADSVRTEL